MKPQEFPRINLKKMSHEQIRILIARVVNWWKSRENIPPLILLLINDLEPLLILLDRILVAEKASALTKEIHDLDELRDRTYRLLVKKIRDAHMEFELALVEAGERLSVVADKFNYHITDLSYSEQTTLTRLAIQEYRKEEFIGDLATLALNSHLERVEKFDKEFEILWDKRADLGADEEKLPTRRYVRENLQYGLGLLLKNSAYLYSKNHPSIDQNLFNKIEDELVKFGATIKMRDTLAANEEIAAS